MNYLTKKRRSQLLILFHNLAKIVLDIKDRIAFSHYRFNEKRRKIGRL